MTLSDSYNNKHAADRASGVVYICTGSYQDMLKNSLSSLKEMNANLNFHVLSDRPLLVPFTWTPIWVGKASRHIKTQLFNYTPFKLTLFVDTDTVFGESIDLDDLLGDCDLAMALDADPDLNGGTRAFLSYSGFTTIEEVNETLDLCGGSFPFFNSGVMVWRQTEIVRDFFEKWHSEWWKYKRADQLALARALHKTKVRVKTLDQRYNFPVMSETLERNKAIYHLIYKEGIARKTGLWNPHFEGLMDVDLIDGLNDGIYSENQYFYIGRRIYGDVGSSSLIIFPRNDEHFWRYCARNNCRFITGNEDLFAECDRGKPDFQFDSKIARGLNGIKVSSRLEKNFDYVIINETDNRSQEMDGTMAWASTLATKKVFVFGYNKKWRREACHRYLGQPKSVIPSFGKGNAELAVFERI